MKYRQIIITFSIIILLMTGLYCPAQSFFTPADTLHQKRFNTALAFSAVSYTGFSIGLYNIWYKKYEREAFHLFNDWGEWEYMDKAGHVHTAYFQGVLCFKGARWTGLSKKKSLLTGIVCGTLFQSTIEVMDGYSSNWGFSLTDMAANISGTATFALQQYYWDEQRIQLKVSSIPASYPNDPILSTDQKTTTTLNHRTDALFGKNYFERFLKDYNAQTYWASVNIHAFLHQGNTWPIWLNLALGYGAQNMYGGFSNRWSENGSHFQLSANEYPRYRQFYIGLDVDLPKLRPRHPFLKTLCSVFNIFKIPSPALEINTQGQITFHFLR